MYERTEKHKKILRENRLGKKHSKKSKELMRKSALLRKPASKETGAKISKALKGYEHTDETKANMKAAAENRWKKHREKQLKKLQEKIKEKDRSN